MSHLDQDRRCYGGNRDGDEVARHGSGVRQDGRQRGENRPAYPYQQVQANREDQAHAHQAFIEHALRVAEPGHEAEEDGRDDEEGDQHGSAPVVGGVDVNAWECVRVCGPSAGRSDFRRQSASDHDLRAGGILRMRVLEVARQAQQGEAVEGAGRATHLGLLLGGALTLPGLLDGIDRRKDAIGRVKHGLVRLRDEPLKSFLVHPGFGCHGVKVDAQKKGGKVI